MSEEEPTVLTGVEGLKLEGEGSEEKKILSPVAKARAAAKAKRGSVMTGSDMAAAAAVSAAAPAADGGVGEKAEGDTESSTGYKESSVAKKGIEDILAADAADESLRKYKESLLGAAAGGGAVAADPNDPRRMIVTEFRVMFDPSEGQPDIVFELDTPEKIEELKKQGVTMKEGAKYKYKISFKVQHEIVAGIKFVNKVKKMMFSEKEELMIGSYPPAVVPHVFEFPRFEFNEAPSGMMFRGSYTVKNQFIDSDGAKHLDFDYELRIKSGWK